MSERPIERLNYFNGQRLEAQDLQLEQDYHVQVQRWLMKTLFSPGVAKGFELHVLDGGKKIRLEPGLALDDLGRAIILVAPVELTPQARLLCIRYAERKERVQEGSCAVNVGGRRIPAEWGGPERILSEPDIFWRADPPMYDTRELVIAELALRPDCTVERLASGPRRFAVPSPIQQVQQLSFEGEKDIDIHNAKIIRFFVRGRRPNEVTLHLQARLFSTLHYTEIGQVTPQLQGNGPGNVIRTTVTDRVDNHTHAAGGLKADVESPGHSHTVKSNVFIPNVGGPPIPGISNTSVRGLFVATEGSYLIPSPLLVTQLGGATDLSSVNMNFVVEGGGHSHTTSGKTDVLPQDQSFSHQHDVPITGLPTGSAGPWSIRGKSQLDFITDLRISVGKAGTTPLDVTDKILDYVKRNYASVWSTETSFDGHTGSPLHDDGTGPIRLDLIDGLAFDPDDFTPYEIKLWVKTADNGGCIKYNLYVD